MAKRTFEGATFEEDELLGLAVAASQRLGNIAVPDLRDRRQSRPLAMSERRRDPLRPKRADRPFVAGVAETRPEDWVDAA